MNDLRASFLSGLFQSNFEGQRLAYYSPDFDSNLAMAEDC